MEMSTHQTSTIDEMPVYGGSVPAPNVQEMLKNDPLNVPERYIRCPQDMPKCADIITPLSSDIPLTDFSLLLEGQEQELKKLDKACKEWGFFQNLDWQDTLALIVFPSKFRRYEFWPTTPEDFKDTVEKCSSEARRVGKKLIGSISLIMGLDSNTSLGLHRELIQSLRLNYYPPCSKPDQVLGLSPHSDASTITVLFQDDDITGLEIRHNGQWVPVNPIPNALVVNIGDVLEIWSNEKYKSIEPRAATNQNMARMSLASFFCPPDDLEIEPLDNMVDSQGKLKMYIKVKFGECLREFMKGKIEGKAPTERAKLKLECRTPDEATGMQKLSGG